MGTSESTVDGPVSIFCPLPSQSDMAWRADMQKALNDSRLHFSRVHFSLAQKIRTEQSCCTFHFLSPYSANDCFGVQNSILTPIVQKKIVHRNFKEL